jgi:probable rRNA maturation factor
MVELNNKTKTNVNVKVLDKVADYVFKKEKRKKQDISVAVVGTARMRELNRTYRGKDYPANVLSFEGEELGLGEIVLCPQVIRKDAKRYGITEQEAFVVMFMHGLMHLLGYDHKTSKEAETMEKKEQAYLKAFNL